MERLLLGSIQADLFTEEGLARIQQEMTRLLAERRRTTTPEVATVKAQLAEMGQQIAHMLTAIKAGFRSDSLQQDLEKAEREKVRLLTRLHDATRFGNVTSFSAESDRTLQSDGGGGICHCNASPGG